MVFVPSEHIQTILRNLPLKPGVYLMKDERGGIIYVGKAKRLRHRVRSYFNSSAEHTTKTLKLRERIRDIDFIVEENEIKALILEETLIKRYRPQFNISLKDDKRYPYIRVSWNQPFPKVATTRRIEQDGARYFGPYVAMWAVQNTLQTLRKAFPYLTCDRVITGNDPRACLFYDIKLCNAPCIGAVNQEQYRAMIQELMDTLSGKSEAVVQRLSAEMEAAAEALDFERAAAVRDQLKAIEYITRQHKAVSADFADRDVIALARDNGETVVQILFIRNGKLIGSDARALDGTEGETDGEILSAFLQRFYSGTAEVPNEVVLPQNIEETRIIERWLKDRRSGKRVTITVPQRGDKRTLVTVAQDNAREALNMMRAQWEADSHKQELALSQLQEALELPRPPNRIECFDISTTQGTAIVASRVVFVQGTPKKAEYRKFNIRTVSHEGSDDYQSMREALTRRFQRWKDAVDDPTPVPVGQDDRDETWRLLPDLLMIDGGKGQLGVAVEVMQEFDLLDRVPVVSLAKQFEEIYRPGNPVPLILPRRSDALFLVQRVRDEAHRFAITSHRQQRQKLGMASMIETVPGVGPAKRKALLKAFGNSISAIRAASVEELATVPGITTKLAEQIKATL
ncbi:MAG TPA: excinuclease ABC subunit UvrC [Candidatus Limnocylindrales bacterium]|nr:excinuclease ABC subunit UvrC [Candidatus Limnocylindrales bacterium]